MTAAGQLTTNTLVWQEGVADRENAASVMAISSLLGQMPMATQPDPTNDAMLYIAGT
ncbi:MAG: hypothetical protein JKY31_04950 [Rhodobacteraceae bacterium]|nr:hypothetical protein [Paracoccaceae bacterium]